MQLLPLAQVVQSVRHWLYPESKYIDDRTLEIDRSIANIRRQKDLVKEMASHVNQPDVLRSLVISMSKHDAG